MNPDRVPSSAGEEEEGPAPTEDGPASTTSTAFVTPGRAKRRSKSSRDLLQRSSSLGGFLSPAVTPRRRGSMTTTSKTQSISRTQSLKGGAALPPSSVDASLWVPDDMALNCCVCKAEFTMYRRRHHCRTCGRVACDDCSSKRIRGDRTCLLCWDRIGRKMSGLGLASNVDTAAAAAAGGGVRKSALMSLLEEERYNSKFVMADGKRVSYAVGGDPDGLPVFLFLGLGCHRHSVAQFEEPARRRGLQLICIDRPGRGRSDPVPSPVVEEGGEGLEEVDVQGLVTEAVQEAVVDTVKQLCAKLRIAKAGILGQSVGALYALRCARDESLRDIFDGTLVSLVSPWVPLAAPGCNPFLQKASSMRALTSTVGLLGGDMMVKQVADMARGSGGASEVEKGYLEAPYTQDLINHVSTVKEGKEAMKNEVFLALHNKGEEEAKERCAAVPHTVKIWHGRSDQLVPYAAMRWLEEALPTCTSTVIPGGTHAFVYDKGSMEEVFAAVHKGVQEARSTARFTARRLSSSLSYVASNVFHAREDSSPTAAAGTAPATAESAAATAAAAGGTAVSLGATAGMMSPRSGKKGDKTFSNQTAAASEPTTTAAVPRPPPKKSDPTPNLRKTLAKALSRNTNTNTSPDSSSHSLASSSNNSRHNGNNNNNSGSSRHSSRHGNGNGSAHGSGSGHGPMENGSGHGGSAHSLSWHSNGSGHGTGGRRLSGNSSGSRHGPGGSRHGSESAPAPIPENGQLVGWTSGLDSKGNSSSGGVSPPGLLGEFGKQFGLALNGTFRTDGGVPAEAVPLPSPTAAVLKDPLDDSARGGGGLDDTSGHSESGSMSGGVGRIAEGFMRQLDRAVSSMSVGDGSGHGSGWGGSTTGGGPGGGGSAHGSIGSTGTRGGGGGGGGGGGASRRSSGLLLPWSQQDVSPIGDDVCGSEAEGSAAPSATACDVEISKRGSGAVGPLGRVFAAVGGGSGNNTPRGNSDAGSLKARVGQALSGAGVANGGGGASSRSSTPRGIACGTPRGERSATTAKLFAGAAAPLTERNLRASTSAASFSSPAGGSVGGGSSRHEPPAASEALLVLERAAGYEAAMANWPAGKVPGNPAWEEWSPEKKLVCHLLTAGCLAVMLLTW